MQTGILFSVDIMNIKGKGDFGCPKCGRKISPDDRTEKTYSILETLMKEQELESVVLQCNKCKSQILLTGFQSLLMNR